MPDPDAEYAAIRHLAHKWSIPEREAARLLDGMDGDLR